MTSSKKKEKNGAFYFNVGMGLNFIKKPRFHDNRLVWLFYCHESMNWTPEEIPYHVVGNILKMHDITTSLIFRKCVVSLSSFVNMSDKLIAPAMCFTVIKTDCADSRTAFSLIWMWRNPLIVMFCDQQTQALLLI